MKIWRVSDPQLKGCAFCGLYDGRRDAVYHAQAWHRGNPSSAHPAWRAFSQITR